MIAASEPQEFVPFGRLKIKNHPGTIVPPLNQPFSENFLVQRLSQVNIDNHTENEWWTLRELVVGNGKGKICAEEELYVKDKTAIWSQGTVGLSVANTNSEQPAGRTLACSYTVESTITHALWVNFVKPGEVRMPSICLLDETKVNVYTKDGEDFLSALQFKVNSAWNTKFGLLLERYTTPQVNFSENNLATLFSLLHPLDEMAPLLIMKSGGSLQYMNDPNLKVVFTSEEPSLVVLFDARTGLHSVWKLRKATTQESQVFCGGDLSTCTTHAQSSLHVSGFTQMSSGSQRASLLNRSSYTPGGATTPDHNTSIPFSLIDSIPRIQSPLNRIRYPKRYPFPTDNMENNQMLNVNKDAINPGIEDESGQREEAEQTSTIPRANQVNILTAVDNQSRMNENSATNTYAVNFSDSLQRREDGATAPSTLNVLVEYSHYTQSVDAIGSDRSNEQTANESQSTALHAIMNSLKQLNENLINTKSELNENLNAKINEISDCIYKTKIELSHEIKTCRETLEGQINELRDNQTEFRNELNAMRDNQDQFREKIDLKIKKSTDSNRESSLEGHASRWFQLIKHDIKNWEDFAQEFTTKYWSRDVQRGIRAKIESEHYKNNGTLTRAEYFTERVITLQSITPLITEEEIVTILSERFEQIIQDSWSVQNINTIKEFERLLQREDIRDGPKRNKIISSQNHNSSGYKPIHQKPHQSPVTPHNNIEQRAYQPRNQYHGQNQHYNDRNQHNKNYYHTCNSRNDNEFKSKTQPYKDHYQNRQNTHYYPGNDRHHPTTEQAQVCTIVRQGENARNPPPSTGNDRSEDFPAAGNGCAL
ncbi:Anaphase-promoting complex subunit 1 [Homalodisca vitripennis]|nr:Anaphase-promoting complex subunit 1 [Homalodisca vitripennis]